MNQSILLYEYVFVYMNMSVSCLEHNHTMIILCLYYHGYSMFIAYHNNVDNKYCYDYLISTIVIITSTIVTLYIYIYIYNSRKPIKYRAALLV